MKPEYGLEPETVAEGRAVVLAWPTPEEVASVLALWERPYVRRLSRFSFPTDFSAWFALRFRLGVPYRGTLAIRFRPDGRFLGTIGWAGWDPQGRSVWVGDLALDYSALRAVGRRFPPGYPGVALDAWEALAGWLSERLGVETFETFVAETNRLARQVVVRAGFQEVGRSPWPTADGPPVSAIFYRQTRTSGPPRPRRSAPPRRNDIPGAFDNEGETDNPDDA